MASAPNNPANPNPGGIFDADELFALARLDLKQGRLAQALAKLKSITQGDDAPAGAYSVCGHLYLQLELPDRAERMFLKHLAAHPGAPDEMFMLGSLRLRTGDNAQALQLWDQLLDQFPTYTPALMYRAVMRAQGGQPTAARQDLEALMKCTPVESPFFKPAKELLQRLDAQLPVDTAAIPTTPYGAAALAGVGYGVESR